MHMSYGVMRWFMLETSRSTCALFQGRDIEDAVGVDVKGDLDLRHASGSWWDACEVKLAKQVVVLCAGALTLVHLNGDSGLVVTVCTEGLQAQPGVKHNFY